MENMDMHYMILSDWMQIMGTNSRTEALYASRRLIDLRYRFTGDVPIDVWYTVKQDARQFARAREGRHEYAS